MNKHILAFSVIVAAPVALAAQTPGVTPNAVSAPISAAVPETPTQTDYAARHAVAQRIIEHVMPPGMMQKMMGGMMKNMMSGFADQIGTMPMADIGKMAENISTKPSETAKIKTQFAKMDKATLGQV
ncbi:MAG: hypothetical protein KGJ05_04000, partial [Alphaproteobacteria bacterium]|nr:hypothetical protein [Alphaproteobacteria bacterium]